ncbi:MAG: type II toxin-antitoxin system RelE/ParE family toxin [Terriglobia bacterium]
MWPIDFTDEYQAWYSALPEDARETIDGVIGALRDLGPELGRPYADTLKGSDNPKLKELRIQFKGRPIRIAFLFTRNRHGVLLCGGIKDGAKDKTFYSRFIGEAEKLINENNL